MNAPLTERLIRFQHPEKTLGYLGVLDDERLAALFGLDVGSYRRLRRTHADRAAEAAGELLAEPGFAAKVDRLPFAPGQRIAALGESTTDDLLSWFEILRHLLLLRRPEDGITPVNLAVSGQTTTQALTSLPDTTVDTVAALARRPGVDAHLEDGLHLSLRGQQALAAALVEALADGPS